MEQTNKIDYAKLGNALRELKRNNVVATFDGGFTVNLVTVTGDEVRVAVENDMLNLYVESAGMNVPLHDIINVVYGTFGQTYITIYTELCQINIDI
jgi:hypothetical protein